MTPDEVKSFESQLKSLADELGQRLESISTELRHEESPLEADSEERVTATENDEVLEALGSAGDQELRQVKAALERIEQGVYGRCVSCGEDITVERLKAIPYAAQCIACVQGQD